MKQLTWRAVNAHPVLVPDWFPRVVVDLDEAHGNHAGSNQAAEADGAHPIVDVDWNNIDIILPRTTQGFYNFFEE